jgi:hypothetical protein
MTYVRCRQGRLWIAALAICVGSLLTSGYGCTSSSDGLALGGKALPQPVTPGDPAITPQRPIPAEYAPRGEDGTPLSFADQTHADGTPTHYIDGSPTYMPDGEPIDYRARDAMQALGRLPTVFLREPSLEPVRLEGVRSNPRRDPQTGAICWLAYECLNPTCPTRPADGRPNVYALRRPGTMTDHGGRLMMPPGPLEADSERWPAVSRPSSREDRCPNCSQREIRYYEPPEIATQRAALLSAIERANSEYAARHAAAPE